MKSVSFEYVNWNGVKVNRKGTIIAQVDGQVVYRDRNDSVYSMPLDDQPVK